MVVPRRSVIGWAIIAAVVGLSGVGRAKVVEQKRKRQRNAKAYALGLRRELSAKKQDWQQDNQRLFHGEHPSGGELAELATRGIQMQRPILARKNHVKARQRASGGCRTG
jgi:adenylate kinase